MLNAWSVLHEKLTGRLLWEEDLPKNHKKASKTSRYLANDSHKVFQWPTTYTVAIIWNSRRCNVAEKNSLQEER